jgi:hypothetical protein
VTFKNKKAGFWVGVGFAIIIGVVLVNFLMSFLIEDKRFGPSIQKFSTQAFGVEYHILDYKRTSDLGPLTDSSAIWHLNFNSNITNLYFNPSYIKKAKYDDDKEWFIDVVRDSFSQFSKANLRKLDFYREDVVLGKDTICPTQQNPCNTYVLKDTEHAFVSLFIN